MGRRKQTYTTEFKMQALELLRTSGKTVPQIAQELGVAKSALYRWQREPARTAEGRRAQAISLEEENRQLRRENQRLKMEQEFLKKAAAFFAKQSG
jgi:transposase